MLRTLIIPRKVPEKSFSLAPSAVPSCRPPAHILSVEVPECCSLLPLNPSPGLTSCDPPRLTSQPFINKRRAQAPLVPEAVWLGPLRDAREDHSDPYWSPARGNSEVKSNQYSQERTVSEARGQVHWRPQYPPGGGTWETKGAGSLTLALSLSPHIPHVTSPWPVQTEIRFTHIKS